MLLVFIAVTLSLVAASPTPKSVTSNVTSKSVTSDAVTPEPLVLVPLLEFPREKENLNEIFREVENLLKDSNSKLADAVKELEAEEISSQGAALKDLPPNYDNKTVKETKLGNDTIITKEEIHKETNNKTGATFLSETVVSSVHRGGASEHECIVDEDCGLSGYCHLSNFIYKCLPCKEQETCSRDGECCDGQLCVWGQCEKSEKGESGTICEKQNDCAPGLCCAVHASLLFPVCTPLLVKDEECQNPDSLLDIFSWGLESESPLNRCPCATGLICQAQSDSFSLVCKDLFTQSKREEEIDLPFLTTGPREEIFYEVGNISPTGIGADLSLGPEEADGEFDPEPRFVDYI